MKIRTAKLTAISILMAAQHHLEEMFMIHIPYLHRNSRIATAFAAVVTACMLASAAKAEIVYHSNDIKISEGIYNLDLNGDGITDFTIASKYTKGTGLCPDIWTSLSETPASGNSAIVGPLRRGEEIGPNQSFSANTAMMSWFWLIRSVVIIGNDFYCKTDSHGDAGPWLGKTGYLGLSFQVNGETYYGWAFMSCPKYGGSGTLLGYAYETIPGRPILAGQISYAWFGSISMNFGTVTVGRNVSHSVILTNLGPEVLTITNASLTGVNADFVSLNGNPPCGGSVAAGEKCRLTFTFTPSVVGKETATYSVYDDGGASPQILNLVGTGQ